MATEHTRYLTQAIRMVAGSVGHELNNQLTIILGNSGLARRKCSEAVRHIDKIEAATIKISNKNRRITALANEMGGARARVSLQKSVDSSLTTLKGDFPKFAAIEVDFDMTSESLVRMDPTSLPTALYFCVYALDSQNPERVQVSVKSLADHGFEIRFEGKGSALTDELMELSQSTCEDILLDETEIGLGLSAAKAFTHRCRGTFDACRLESGAKRITMSLPPSQDPTSFIE